MLSLFCLVQCLPSIVGLGQANLLTLWFHWVWPCSSVSDLVHSLWSDLLQCLNFVSTHSSSTELQSVKDQFIQITKIDLI